MHVAYFLRLCWLAGWLLITWLGAPAPAAATTYLWQGPNAGSWTDPNNWSPSTGIPNSDNDIAVIPARSTPLAIAIPVTTITLGQLRIIPGAASGAPVTIVGASATLVPGSGIFSEGADHVIQVPVVLARNALVDVANGSLTFQLTLSESGAPRTLLKTGAGTVIFTSTISYSGPTVVQEGALRLTFANIVPDTARVNVNPRGTFEPQQNEAIGNLTIFEGDVNIGPNVSLSVASLDMTGGTINSGGFPELLLRGDVTMTSTTGPNGTPVIVNMTLSLGNATRTFTVRDGPDPIDGAIHARIAGDPTVGLIKQGAGTLGLRYQPSVYGGLTWVKQGRLDLDRNIPADLRIGDGVGPAGEAVVFNSRTLPTMNADRSVVVEADGLYDLGNWPETFDQLTINGGTVTPGNQAGALQVRSLVMNGGVIETAGNGMLGDVGVVRLRNVPNVRLEATSTATQTPIIRGSGRLALDGSPDMIVHDGPQPIDLKIDVGIGSTTQGLKKSGLGVAQFTVNNQYPGPTNIAAGTLLIDGTQPVSLINLTGGTLGGAGRTGPIFAGAGAIAPGRSPGILRSGDVALGAGVTFAPELNGTLVGTGYDQLKVTGIVALANATLAPVVAPNVTLPQNATLTIIDNDGTDAVSGTFANLAEGATVIADRHVFRVSYHGGDGNDVVLTVIATQPQPEPTPGAVTYYLAEGATGGFFDEDVLIANPNDVDAPVTLTFLQEGGGTVVEHRTVPKQGG